MLFYLDNWLSADPNAAEQPQQLQQRGNNRRRARLGGAGQRGRQHAAAEPAGAAPQRPQRELRARADGAAHARRRRRLHAAGHHRSGARVHRVDAWRTAAATAGFRFTPALHDRGEKMVLGQTISAGGGIEDGERVLDIVAAHPSTATHIATKLARRFVSDEPPAALVDSVAAARFTRDQRRPARGRADDRDVAGVLRRRGTATPRSRRRSSSSSARVRATGATCATRGRCCSALQQLGMPLYMCQPPTGYDDTAETWVSAGALVARMNIAQQLPDAAAAAHHRRSRSFTQERTARPARVDRSITTTSS